jgi:hypothetical protein
MPYADRAKYLECCRLAGRRYRRNHEAQLERARAYREAKQAADPPFVPDSSVKNFSE